MFDQWTKWGLEGKLRGKSDKKNNRFNTSRKREEADVIPFALRQHSTFAGVDGKKSFILCKIVPHRKESVEGRKQQMNFIANELESGTKFWTRVDGKTDPLDPNQPMDGEYVCFNEITFIGIRDRFNKATVKTRCVKKVLQPTGPIRPVLSPCKKWVLAEVLDIDIIV